MSAEIRRDATAHDRPIGLAILLIVAGTIGWFAAFTLMIEKITLLENPGSNLSCDFGLLVQCTANLESWQGSVFGFSNPILGIAGWVAPISVGTGILAGARFARWYWLAFNVGVAGALAFVIWLISQSIFVIGTLCPWCMVTWSVTIPVFVAVTLHTLRSGLLPSTTGIRHVASVLYGWIPVVTLACYLVVAIIAQLRLDVLSYL